MNASKREELLADQYPPTAVDWQRTISIRMDAFERQLKENTDATNDVKENTQELVDILNSWKGAMQVFAWLGKVAKPIAAVVTFVGTVWALWPKR